MWPNQKVTWMSVVTRQLLVYQTAALCGCAWKLLLSVACLGEVIGYTEEGFRAAPDCKTCPEKRERFSARETRDRKWCQWPRRQGEGTGGVPRTMCTSVCVCLPALRFPARPHMGSHCPPIKHCDRVCHSLFPHPSLMSYQWNCEPSPQLLYYNRSFNQ